MIEYRTFFNFHKTADPKVLKKAYETWCSGAINMAREDRAKYYFHHFVISGITYKDFIKLTGEY